MQGRKEQGPEVAHIKAAGIDSSGALRRAIDLHRSGNLDGAIDAYRAVLAREPDQFDAHRLLGAALAAAGRALDGIAEFERALAIRRDSAEVWTLRGDALAQTGNAVQAAASYEQALALEPKRARTWNNHGLQMTALGRIEEAHASHRRAAALAPDDAQFGFNLALSELTAGRLLSGWPGFERRQRLPAIATPFPVLAPVWQPGQDLAGRRLLVVCEQGLGDTIQFARLLPALVTLGAQVLVNRPPPLRGLIETVGAGIEWLDVGQPLPAFDWQCGMMSLGHRLGIELDSIPARVPYLHAAPAAVASWRKAIGPPARPRIGIACSGNPKHANDRRRSVALREFEALAGLGAELHLLQNELRPDDEPWLARLGVVDHRERLTDLAQAAALMNCLDAVVSVDTALAHLAGALGLPLWILLPLGPDWRWMSGRVDSPWYPTARLARQREPGAWSGVIGTVAADLRHALLP